MASPPNSVASAPRARRWASNRVRGAPLGTWMATMVVTSRVPPLLSVVVPRLTGTASETPLRCRWVSESTPRSTAISRRVFATAAADMRRTTRDHLEERGPERVEVGPPVDVRVASRLLWRHVRGRAHDRAGAGQLRVLRRGDAEVDQFDLEGRCPIRPASREDDVRRFDVAMHDSGGVRGGQGFCQVGCDEHARGEPQRSAPLPLGDVFAVQPLHRDIGVPLLELTERHYAHDARVVQPGKQPSFATKPRLLPRVDAWQRDDLQRDRMPAELVARAVHDAHATAANLALDDEASGERLARCGVHALFPEPTTKISVLTERVPSGRMRRSFS
jgi:hypothetical protein